MKAAENLISPKTQSFTEKKAVKKPPVFFAPKPVAVLRDDYAFQKSAITNDQYFLQTDLNALTKISPALVQRKCSRCEEERLQLTKELEDKEEEVPAIVERAIQSDGESLDTRSRFFMENQFGQDFSTVKIHTGELAENAAESIQANAYTQSDHIVFNKGQYAPSSFSGKSLLAHELAHVVQQRAGKVQTKRIQRDCLTTVPGSDYEPYVYVRNGQRLAAEFTDAAGAEAFMRGISGETLVCHQITRRSRTIYKVYRRTSASTSGGTSSTAVQDEIFNQTEIDRMQSFFINNASNPDHLACINTVRGGLGSLLYDNPDVMGGTCPDTLTMTTNNTMDETMAQLGTHGIAAEIAAIIFNDSRGTAIARGSGREPMQASSSIWSAIITAIGTQTGWSVFGLSVCDGYHSVTISVNHTDLDNIRMYWSDQTTLHEVRTEDRISGISGSQYGWERMAQTGTSQVGTDARGLDEYIRYAVRSFWGLTADEARGTTPLTTAQRNGRTLGVCFPQVRIWRISRPNP